MDASPRAATIPLPVLDPEQRARARRSLTVLGVLGAGSLLGVAFSLYLVNHFPLLLVALSPLGRHILLAVPVTHPAALLVVTVVRRLVFFSATHALGAALGDAGITWIEARAAYFARFVRWLEGLFARAPRLVVFLMTGPVVSTLAGIHGMPRRQFLPLAGAGLTLRIAITIAFGEVLREPLEWLLALIDRYWIPGTIVMVTGVSLHQWRRWRTAREPDLA